MGSELPTIGNQALGILGQRVQDGVPRHLRADPKMRQRSTLRVGVKGAEPDAPNFGLHVPAAVDRRTTSATERSELTGRGFILGHKLVTGSEFEVDRSR